MNILRMGGRKAGRRKEGKEGKGRKEGKVPGGWVCVYYFFQAVNNDRLKEG